MSVPTTSTKSGQPNNDAREPAAEEPRTIRGGRVVTGADAVAPTKATTAPRKAAAKPSTAKTASSKPAAKTAPSKTASTKASTVKTAKPALSREEQEAKAERKAARAAKQARVAERIRQTDEQLDQAEANTSVKKSWVLVGVLGVLVFQVVHSSEHVAQVVYWLFNPTAGPWMSKWAMSLTMGLGSMSGGGVPLGMELLHLIGNTIFLTGLLLAARLPERFHNDESRKWLRIATLVQVAHVAEHVLLTVSVSLGGSALGLSTLFGLMTPGTPAAVGYRVLFHLAINLVATYFAMRAVLASRRVQPSLKNRDGRIGYALLVAPIVGLIFLVPVFAAHAPNSAAADPSVIVATVNGTEITSAELADAVELAKSLNNTPQLGNAASPIEEAPTGTEGQTEEEITITALNRLVQTALIEQGAAELGVEITPADLEARKEELITSDFLNRQNFEKFLRDNNATEAYADTQVRSLLLQEGVHETLTADTVIPPESIQSVFEDMYEGFPRGRQLLTVSEDAATALLQRAEAGENFEQLVRNESTDARAISTGGYMGPIRVDAQVPEITDAVYDMQDNEFRVVQTQFGWHVLQRLTPATLAEVEPEIRENLLLTQKGNAGQAWLADLRAAAQVDLTEGYGVWNTEFGAVVTPDFAG